jgi:uncharacterized protein
LKSSSDSPIYSADLFITEDCNMKCTYCFHQKGREASKGANQTMSIEEGKKILDRLYELYPERMTINFFGGEPLLYPDTVIALGKYAKALWKDQAFFFISTNGTVFDENLFAELKALNVYVQVSFDGDRETQELYRGSFDIVSANIKKMIAFGALPAVRLTFTPDSVSSLMKNIQYIHDLGVVKIVHHAVMEADWTEDAIKEYNVQLINLLHYRRYCLNKEIPFNIGFIDKNLMTLNDEIPLDEDFCAAGKSFIAILPNGDVYPCHRAVSKRLFKLGNIFIKDKPFVRGIFLDISKATQGCKQNCKAAKTCHTCIMTQFDVTGDLQKPLHANHYCDICNLEHELCKQYLPTEISDKHGRMLTSLAQVVADMADKINALEVKDVKPR